ncbi:hypothetical protein EDD27_1798 [Nonomuraea polychroma]|uniref:Uncharacterized protein n=1 Tax=Nonomuraea polychroma TaxID=46176 RepID=A0A438M1C1_9ACTN|nr:hypothetical protein [Nonomuraea polychroma]RVX39441.1 hypothetical protein EDD27_1798 [Nonomuraea polychroma]
MARTGLVLLALGPVLAAAYAAVNHTAIRAAAKAQVDGRSGRAAGSAPTG